MTRLLKNKKGFTLIELIVVVAILGILSAIAIPRLSGFSEKARVSADAASARTIQSAISIAEADGHLNLQSTADPTLDAIKAAVLPEYLAAIPKTQTTGTNGWLITIAGSAGSRTVTIVAAPGVLATTGWITP